MASNIVAPAYYICQARLPNLWSLTFFMTPKFLTHNLKLLFAAHHFIFKSKDPKAIANVLNVKKSKIEYWMKSHEWIEAISYWRGNRPIEGDLNLAESVWTEMIEQGEDMSPVDYPERPEKCSKRSQNGNLDVYSLIQSHLFCIDNLTEDEIQEHLANEDNDGMKPVRYDGQYLESSYRWWIFPNAPEGLYSKCLARANIAGDLVIDFAGETCLVCIRYGCFTLTRQIADDVANVFDERLLVFL